MSDIMNILWIVILIQLFVPMFQKRMMAAKRMGVFRKIEKAGQSRVISLINRLETMSFLGFPVARYIDIEDSEHVLRAIRMTPPEMPIDLILHTPGGLVLASEQIACALETAGRHIAAYIE